MSDAVQSPIGKLLKAKEVAEILRVSRTHVHRLLQSGELPSVRFGQQTVRVRQEDLERFLEESRVNGKAKPR